MLPTGETEQGQLTEELAVPWERAWPWAHGEQALPSDTGSTAAERVQWLDHNRPYMSPFTIHEVERLLELREVFAPFRVEIDFDGERAGGVAGPAGRAVHRGGPDHNRRVGPARRGWVMMARQARSSVVVISEFDTP